MNDAIDALIADLPRERAARQAKNEFADILAETFIGDEKISSKTKTICFAIIATPAIIILGLAFLI